MPGQKKARRRMSWDEWYRLASEYRVAHGNLLVHRDYVCPAGEKLGRWIERQRAKYNGVESVPGHLDRVQVAMLNRIGMVWKLEYRRPWGDWLKQLDWYRANYGSLDIPGDFEHESYCLGNWVKEQRKRRASGLLSPQEIADLDARGMLWNVKTRPRSWEDWYADAEAYYKAHGDLMVSPDYETADGHRLGIWIYGQRDIYMGRKQGLRLTAEKIDRLNAIHMVWSPTGVAPEAWEQMYRWVSDYHRQNGRLPLWPRDLKAPDGRSMCGWIRTQRALLAEGRMNPSRRDKLERIGIRPAEKAPRTAGAAPG